MGIGKSFFESMRVNMHGHFRSRLEMAHSPIVDIGLP